MKPTLDPQDFNKGYQDFVLTIIPFVNDNKKLILKFFNKYKYNLNS